jgi:hypothetical protein
MRGFKIFAVAFLFVLAAHTGVLAQAGKGGQRAQRDSTAQRLEDAKRLVEATGVVDRELRQMEPLLARMRQQMPNVPEKVWKEVETEFRRLFTRETIIDMYAPVYSRHFGPDEVRRLLVFYNSPVGKKLVSETPMIEIEVFLDGVRRGTNLGEKIREMLKAKGYDTPIT